MNKCANWVYFFTPRRSGNMGLKTDSSWDIIYRSISVL